MSAHAIVAKVSDRPGMLHGLTGVLADHDANITEKNSRHDLATIQQVGSTQKATILQDDSSFAIAIIDQSGSVRVTLM